ncbi:hypothetical protein MMC30_007931 [Trapelia coarctata]|nr:hypothetical protein [Trapelia coarctata]
MAPYFIPLLLSVFAVGALSKKPGCDSTCYSGFTDIPGIASLCNNANRPTTTIEQSVTAYTTIVSTVTVSNYRYTDYHYTTPTPTKLASCGTPHALAAPLAAQTVSSGDLILTKVAAARPTAAALMPRNQKCQSCPPIKEGITSACSCFFTAGPQQTVTHNHTVATGTVYSTTTTTTFVYSVRTRTVAGA